MKGASDVGNEVDHAAVVARIGPAPTPAAVGQVVRGGFAFRLAFVLEPYCDGFYFPVLDSEPKCASATDAFVAGRKQKNMNLNVHSTCRGNGLAVFTGRV